MAKRILRDIAGPQRRSIQDIRREDVSDRRPIRRPRIRQEATEEDISAEHTSMNGGGNKTPMDRFEERGTGEHRPRYLIWIAAVAVLAVLFLIVSTVLSGARITIVPMQASAEIDTTINAYQNALEGELPFRIVEISDVATKDVPATEEHLTERKASGQIIIYNAYDDRNQRLIKNTRFETPDEKIYRISESITVPGTTVKEGKIVPGSIEVTVYADVPGDEYNIGLTDFTIPGFEGDPRFDKFYARSKTDMTRGFSGIVKTVSDSELAVIDAELQGTLSDILNGQIAAQVLEEFIVFDDTTIIEIKDAEPSEESTSNTATVKVEGSVNAIIFDREELSSAIAKEILPSYDGSPVLVSNFDALTVSMIDKDAFTPEEDNEISFTISGVPNIVWIIDEGLIKTSLSGKPKASFPSIIEKHVSIKRAEAKIRPFWKSSFPEDVDKLKIELVGE